MNGSPDVFAAPHSLPGWFGKLPGIGDFAHRRLPQSLREPWDRWLQDGLVRLRLYHTDWVQRYLEGPLWFFLLARDVVDEAPWIGVIMPSVDGVGRYFPFTVASALRDSPQALGEPAWPQLLNWWQAAAQAALEALDQDMDAIGFDALLALRLGDAAPSFPTHSAPPQWPAPGQSLWLTDPAGERQGRGEHMRAAGLPRDVRFCRLFGAGSEAGLSGTGWA